MEKKETWGTTNHRERDPGAALNAALIRSEAAPWSPLFERGKLGYRESSLRSGFLMFESLELTNFRGFDSLKIDGLKRFNVITGANASGKSSLLEAIVCGSKGTPEAFLSTGQMRGVSIGLQNVPIPGLAVPIFPQNFRPIWDQWFYTNEDHIQSKSFKISYTDNTKNGYSIEASYGTEQTISNTNLSGGLAGVITPLHLLRRQIPPKGTPRQTSASVTLSPQGQIQVSQSLPPLGPSTFIFSAAQVFAEPDNVQWLSNLRAMGKKGELTSFIKTAFPFINDLEILSLGGSTGVYADLGNGNLRRLQLISSGINKIVSILLAASNSSGGVLLIDEIENGIFYDKYELVWDILYKFAVTFGFQIFVTSHSAECLEQIVPVIGDKADDFSLIRMEREGSKCIARHISGASMKAALKRGAEIRGVTEVTNIKPAVGAEFDTEAR